MKIFLISFLMIVLSAGSPFSYVEKKIIRSAGKTAIKSSTKSLVKKTILKSFSRQASKSMTKEVFKLFRNGGYKEIFVNIKGKNKPLLISPKFDPYLKVKRQLTGDFNPVLYHNNNPKYVKEGLETNLGRMKRGLAPVYEDANNPDKSWCGYRAFELHHGGQKADPDYYALMAEDHKSQSRILHPNRKNSEINRADFSNKERRPLYKSLSNYIN